jgi:RimJ/RimL family protein N-acetyltransferase
MTAIKAQPSLPSLICKPSDYSSVLHTAPVSDGNLIFRSLHLSSDLDIINNWVNQNYSRRFWQLNGCKRALKATYDAILQNPHAHSFMAFLNDVPVGQIDIYQVLSDELRDHVKAAHNDCGMHLLMLPPKQSRKYLSLELLRAFLSFYFSFTENGCLYAEPDSQNATANLLARKAGFNLLKTITLSNKTANLYLITRERFQSLNS